MALLRECFTIFTHVSQKESNLTFLDGTDQTMSLNGVELSFIHDACLQKIKMICVAFLECK